VIFGAACPAGRATTFGPPFADPCVQATYEAQVKKLSSSLVITEDTAKSVVAGVINSALSAGESAVPKIEARVREVAAAAAGTSARNAVSKLLLGTFGAVLLGAATWGVVTTVRR